MQDEENKRRQDVESLFDIDSMSTQKRRDIMFQKLNDLLFAGCKRGGRKISFQTFLSKMDVIIDSHDQMYLWGQRFNTSRKDQIKFFDVKNMGIWKDEIIPEMCKYYLVQRCVIRRNNKNGKDSILINYKRHLIKEG